MSATPESHPLVRPVGEATFEAEVLAAGRPVVVDFWAPWCGPCRMVAPELARLAERYADRVRVVSVNVDEEPGLARAFGIASIPTIAFFPNDGRGPQGVVGFRPLEELERFFGLAGPDEPAA